MGNRLKDIFNDSELQNYMTVSFDNDSASKSFAKKMLKMWETGETQMIEGTASVTTGIGDGFNHYMEKETYKMQGMQISPSKIEKTCSVQTDYGVQQLHYRYFVLKDKIVFKSNPDAPIMFDAKCNPVDQTCELKWQLQPANAGSMKELVIYYDMMRKVFNDILTQEVESIPEDWKPLEKRMKEDQELYYRLWKIEEKLNIHFNPHEFKGLEEEKWRESVYDIEELYYAVVLRYPLRLKAKLRETKSTAVYLDKGQKLDIGSDVTLTYEGTVTYRILDQEITLYTANILCDAVVKKIEESDEKAKIQYGERDSRPMYIAYTVFQTEDEAACEVKRIMDHENDYRNAKTWDQYLSDEKGKNCDSI